MKIINYRLTKYILSVAFFAILVVFNCGNVLAASQPLPAKGVLDSPKNGAVVKGDLSVRGWFLDGNGVAKIEVLVDGKSIGQAQYGITRLDVYKAYPTYKNTNSGYQYTLKTTTLKNGLHSLTVKETDKKGATHVLSTISVSVQNLTVKGNIETPVNQSTIKGDVKVKGWFLDLNGVTSIEVLIDGKSAGKAQYGISRLDVYKAYPGFNNQNSGYLYTLNTRNLTNGSHSLTIKETDKNGTTHVLPTVKVNVQNLPVKGHLDAPANGATIKNDVKVKGWYLDVSGVSKVEVLVDGKSIDQAQYGISRLDVYNAYPSYQNKNAGYEYTLNTKKLTNGQHKLTVKETGKNGSTNVLSGVTVNVSNLPVKGSIDTPANNSTVKGTVNVKGWLLDVSGVSKVQVLVDGKSLGLATYGSSRTDVQKVYPAYQNANSGYQFSFSSIQFSDGKHTLTIKETGGNGATFTMNRTLYIYNGSPYKYIDLRKPANITATDIVNYFNRTHPDSPLKAFAQNFIDAQNKYGVNAQYLVAHAIWETGWGSSNLLTYKHNLFGYHAFDVCPFTCGNYFPSGAASINYEAYIVRKDYLESTGSFYNGSTLTGMNVKYATDSNWANGIAGVMESIKAYDANYYVNTAIHAASSTAAPSYGSNIPADQPYPSSVIINYTSTKTATVMTDGLMFRSLPYASASYAIKKLSLGTVVTVLGYNTDVKFVSGDIGSYPYDYRWYRVRVNGQEGWLYGGGIFPRP